MGDIYIFFVRAKEIDNIVTLKICLIVHFYLPKNEPKKAAYHLVHHRRTTLCCLKIPSAVKLASLKQSSRLSDIFCAARLREMAKKVQ
jgi:hypothetical protein